MYLFIEEACSCLTWLTGTLHHGPSSSSLSRRSFSSCTPTDTRGEKTCFWIRQHLCKRHLHLLTSLVLPLQIIVRITRPVFKSIWLIIHVYMYVILWNTKVTAQSSAFQGVWEHRGDGYAAAGGDEVLLDGLLVLHHPPRPHLCPHHDFRPGKRAFERFDFFI